MRTTLLAFTAIIMVCTQAVAADINIKPTYSSHDLSAFPKWLDALDRTKSQSQSSAYTQFVDSLQNLSPKLRMQVANEYFNKFPYIEDQDNWGVEDYWETPYELIAKGGDCEDYTIAKYMALKATGTPAKDMEIAVVYDMQRNGFLHAVLLVREGGKRYVLDNQNKAILPIEKVTRYKMIYTINEAGWESYF